MTINYDQREVKDICKKTGLEPHQIEVRLHNILKRLDGLDSDSLDDYYGSAFFGMCLNDWIVQSCDDWEMKEIESLAKIADFIVYGTNCKSNRIFLLLPSVVLRGDGECPNCGSDDSNEFDRSGRYYGDGYYTELEFSGVIEKTCNHCGNSFEVSN